MNIGQASRQSDISVKMIRYYEEIGLFPPVARTASGYRHYGDTDVHRLRFIRRARDLGFSMDHIRALLALWDDHSRQNAQVREVATEHIKALQERIIALESMVSTLQTLIDACAGHDRPDCPILEELNRGHSSHASY